MNSREREPSVEARKSEGATGRPQLNGCCHWQPRQSGRHRHRSRSLTVGDCLETDVYQGHIPILSSNSLLPKFAQS
jgi:hypothetical protein